MTESPLERAAARASRVTFFLGSAVDQFCALEDLSDAELARHLGCDAIQLAGLRLCRRPDGSSASFGADVRRIAERFELDASALADVLRRVESLAALRDADDSSLLAAARDRVEPDDDTCDEDPVP